MSIQERKTIPSAPNDLITRTGWARIAALAGIAFVVMQIASTVAAGGAPPDVDASTVSIINYYASHHTGLLVTDFLFALSAVALLWFFGGLATAIRQAEGAAGMLATIASGSGMVMTSLIVVDAAAEAALTFKVARLVDPVLVRGLYDLSHILFSFIWIPAAVLVSATSTVAIADRLFPRWLGWVGMAAAVVMLVASAGLFADKSGPLPALSLVAFVLFLLWTVAISIVLFQRAHVSEAGSAGV